MNPWQIRTSDFPAQGSVREQLLFLLRYAILAPSSNNSQPWRFGIEGDCIRVLSDERYWLRVCDPDRRELHLSVGCALENLLVAAEHFGFGHRVDYFPEAGDPSLAAVVQFAPRWLAVGPSSARAVRHADGAPNQPSAPPGPSARRGRLIRPAELLRGRGPRLASVCRPADAAGVQQHGRPWGSAAVCGPGLPPRVVGVDRSRHVWDAVADLPVAPAVGPLRRHRPHAVPAGFRVGPQFARDGCAGLDTGRSDDPSESRPGVRAAEFGGGGAGDSDPTHESARRDPGADGRADAIDFAAGPVPPASVSVGLCGTRTPPRCRRPLREVLVE